MLFNISGSFLSITDGEETKKSSKMGLRRERNRLILDKAENSKNLLFVNMLDNFQDRDYE